MQKDLLWNRPQSPLTENTSLAMLRCGAILHDLSFSAEGA